jgi:hypothetical protein
MPTCSEKCLGFESLLLVAIFSTTTWSSRVSSRTDVCGVDFCNIWLWLILIGTYVNSWRTSLMTWNRNSSTLMSFIVILCFGDWRNCVWRSLDVWWWWLVLMMMMWIKSRKRCSHISFTNTKLPLPPVPRVVFVIIIIVWWKEVFPMIAFVWLTSARKIVIKNYCCWLCVHCKRWNL